MRVGSVRDVSRVLRVDWLQRVGSRPQDLFTRAQYRHFARIEGIEIQTTDIVTGGSMPECPVRETSARQVACREPELNLRMRREAACDAQRRGVGIPILYFGELNPNAHFQASPSFT